MRFLKTIKVPAKLENLHACMSLVSSCAENQEFDSKRISEIELATEEALVNIFNYAYQENIGNVEISCFLDDNALRIEFVDFGVPFDMLKTHDPNLSANIDERKIGGLGIFMIKKLMDDVKYKREAGKNILTLIVRKAGKVQTLPPDG
jgi:serine/threonine-protein kinase RsbW